MFKINIKCSTFRSSSCFTLDPALIISRTGTFLPSCRSLTHFTYSWTKKSCFKKHLTHLSHYLRWAPLMWALPCSSMRWWKKKHTVPSETTLSYLLAYDYRKPSINTRIPAVGEKVLCCLNLKHAEGFVVPYESFTCSPVQIFTCSFTYGCKEWLDKHHLQKLLNLL